MQLLAELDKISAVELGWLIGFVHRAMCADILHFLFPPLVSSHLLIGPNSVGASALFDFRPETTTHFAQHCFPLETTDDGQSPKIK
jgi:hypothetical protein